MLRSVTPVVLLAFTSCILRAVQAASCSLKNGIDIWVHNLQSNLSSVLKMYSIVQSILGQKRRQTAQLENPSWVSVEK